MASVMLVLILSAVTLLGTAEANWAGMFLRDVFTRPILVGKVHQPCRRDSELFHQALERLEPWALHMYDSSGKIPAGTITGNIVELGNYDQCLSVKAPSFRGRHCSAAITVDLLPDFGENVTSGGLRELVIAVGKAAGIDDVKTTVTYRWYFCVPSTCDADDLASSLRTALAPLDAGHSGTRIAVTVDDKSCSPVGVKQLGPADYGFIGFVLLIFLVVISSTLYHSYLRYNGIDEKDGCKAVMAFSLRANWNYLWKTTLDPNKYPCFDGVRFLSISWIVLGHSYYVATATPQINLWDVTQWRYQWHKMSIMTGTVSTDTFFVIGSSLLTLNHLRYCERIGATLKTFKLYFFKLYFLRYIRLTPAYATVIFFYATLMRFIGDGPLWERFMGVETENCLANWWVNLVYMNNYLNLVQQCVNQTWYLAVDFQLVLLSPVLLFPLWALSHRPGLVFIGLGFFLALGIASPLIVTVVKGLPGAMLYGTDFEYVAGVFVYVYLPAYTRAGPFVVGIVLGYILHHYKGQKLPLGKWTVAALWISCFTLLLVCVYGILPQYVYAPKIHPVEAALFAGFQRTTWAIAVAWMILACCKGLGGPVNTILSLPVMQPLGKLSYCIYLTHYIFVNYYIATQRTTGAILDYSLVVRAIGTMVLTLAASTVLFLSVEMPSTTLSRVYVRDSEKQESNSPPTASESVSPPPPPILSLSSYVDRSSQSPDRQSAKSQSPDRPSVPSLSPPSTPPLLKANEEAIGVIIFENNGFRK